MSATTAESSNLVSRQQYDPWGKVRSGGVTQTKLNYTGQRKDDTGLLYYHARYYDPSLGRFVSPDSIVPGASSGVGGAGGTVGAWQNSSLTVDFHESGFLSSVGGENARTLQRGFWFQLDNRDRDAYNPSGPDNPQALNRYAYVIGNPLRYIDPSGHLYIKVLKERRGSKVGTSMQVTLGRNELKALIHALENPQIWINYVSATGANGLGAYLATLFATGLSGAAAAAAAAFGATIGALIAGLPAFKYAYFLEYLKGVYARGGTVTFTMDIWTVMENIGFGWIFSLLPGTHVSEQDAATASTIPDNGSTKYEEYCRSGQGPNYSPC